MRQDYHGLYLRANTRTDRSPKGLLRRVGGGQFVFVLVLVCVCVEID